MNAHRTKRTKGDIRIVLVALALPCLALAQGPPSSVELPERPTGKVYRVVMKNHAFQPATLELRRGDAVEWVNEDGDFHTAVSTSGQSFDAGGIRPGSSFRWVATEPGIETYSCPFHAGMSGTLIVH